MGFAAPLPITDEDVAKVIEHHLGGRWPQDEADLRTFFNHMLNMKSRWPGRSDGRVRKADNDFGLFPPEFWRTTDL